MPLADPLLNIFLSSQHIPINPRPHDPSSSRYIAIRRALGLVSYTCQHVLIPYSPFPSSTTNLYYKSHFNLCHRCWWRRRRVNHH